MNINDANDRLLVEDSSGSYTVYTYVQKVGRNDYYDTIFVTKKQKYDSWQMANLLESYSYTTNYVGRITGATIERSEAGTGIKIQSGYSYLYNHAGMRVCVDQYVQNQSTYAIISDTSTKYLIDENNPTGYTQVIEERTEDLLNSTDELKTYTLGLDVITQADDNSPGDDTDAGDVHFLMYDGHGSTRYLTDATGQVNTGELYSYETYGDLRGGNPGVIENSTATNLLYSGEMFDASLKLYNLRARYYDSSIGRFPSMDPYGGDIYSPLTLNKYGYCHGDPINGVDPSGMFFTYVGQILSRSVQATLRSKKVRAAWKVYDTAQNLSDAIKITSQVAVGNGLSPMLVAGLLMNYLPFGKLLSKGKIVGGKITNSAGKLISSSGSMTKSADSLTAALKGFGNAGAKITDKSVELVGQLGAIGVAKKLGLTAVEDFPVRYHGIDGLFRKGKNLVIVEAKGGAGALGMTKSGQQLSQEWVKQKVKTLRNHGDIKWADQLKKAYKNNQLGVLLVKTPVDKVDGIVDDPSYMFKIWKEISPRNY